MEPGPELDALIAEKVMGIDLKKFTKFDQVINAIKREKNPELLRLHARRLAKLCAERDMGTVRVAPPFSTDIRAAWEVVEKMTTDNRPMTLMKMNGFGTAWCCGFHEDGVEPTLWAKAPLAICSAALKAVE